MSGARFYVVVLILCLIYQLFCVIARRMHKYIILIIFNINVRSIYV